jgi:Fe-S cluster biosynthesis and repair protein YggX
MIRIKQELKESNMEDILEYGKNNGKSIWKRISKRCVVAKRKTGTIY